MTISPRAAMLLSQASRAMIVLVLSLLWQSRAAYATPELSGGCTAGIVVGAVCATAFTALVGVVVGFLLYRHRQATRRRTHIESRQLSNKKGVNGFYSAPKVMTSGTAAIEPWGEADDSPSTIEGIPPEWEIKADQIQIYIMDGKPVVLGWDGSDDVFYAKVYKEDAAVKIIPGKQRDQQAGIIREITIMERARTDYVVRFLGCAICQDGILLAMEYMAGGHLWEAIGRDDEFHWYNRGIQAIRDVASGLYVLHQHRIAHNDLKSPNCWITENGRVKISNVRLGRFLTGDETQSWDLPVHKFSSPEQIRGLCTLASDIFALGTIIWEVCSLHRPELDIWGEYELRVPEDAPQAVVDLILACRRDNPTERPSIGEVCDILDNIQSEEQLASVKILA